MQERTAATAAECGAELGALAMKEPPAPAAVDGRRGAPRGRRG